MRGERAKNAANADARHEACPIDDQQTPDRRERRRRWAALIKRVYEVDPLACPACGHPMTVVSFINPGQREVIDAILTHCGLAERPCRAPPPHHTSPPHEVTYASAAEFADAPPPEPVWAADGSSGGLSPTPRRRRVRSLRRPAPLNALILPAPLRPRIPTSACQLPHRPSRSHHRATTGRATLTARRGPPTEPPRHTSPESNFLSFPLWLLAVTSVLSNVVGNNPTAMLLVPYIHGGHPAAAGAAVALGTGFSSNAIVFGSLAGIIVVEAAARHGVRISFGEFSRAGVPVAVATMLLAAAWIWML